VILSATARKLLTTEIPYPAAVFEPRPSGHRAWSGPLRSSLVSQSIITTSGPVRLLTALRVGFPLPRSTAPTHLTGPNPTSVRRDQASPGHAALCPTMPPANTTDPPWCPLDIPSSLRRGVGSPGVCADRFAERVPLRLRPGRLPQVLRIPPRDGHPTLLGYGPYPVGPAGLSPAREQHCRAHALEIAKPATSTVRSSSTNIRIDGGGETGSTFLHRCWLLLASPRLNSQTCWRSAAGRAS